MSPRTPSLRRPFQEPVTIPPRGEHTHSLVFLHGRGDSGGGFGPHFITIKLAGPDTSNTLAKRFPTMKFIFPSALELPSRQFGGVMSQWFDMRTLSLNQTQPPKDRQRAEMRHSINHVRSIIDAEVALVGAENVLLGGFSQGNALGLHVLLGYGDGDGKGALGGYIGMSGWLPFQDEMTEIVPPEKRIEEGKKVAMGTGLRDMSTVSTELAMRGVNFTREFILELPPIESKEAVEAALATPLWISHGVKDDLVPDSSGERGAQTMELLGWEVTWMLYDDVDHFFPSYLVEDMAIFMSARMGVPDVD